MLPAATVQERLGLIDAPFTATLLFMTFLMLVGASPGSCGGGIKTTTLAVLAAFSWNRLRHGRAVHGDYSPADWAGSRI